MCGNEFEANCFGGVVGSLPAFDGVALEFVAGVGIAMVGDCTAANAGAVGLEVEATEQFTGRGPVGGGQIGREEFGERRRYFVGTVGPMIAAGKARQPKVGGALGAGAQISGARLVEAAGTDQQSGGDLLRGELVGAGQAEVVTDQQCGNTVGVLKFFISPRVAGKLDLSLWN